MELLDDIDAPSGKELVTQRPAWRVRSDDGRERWAFAEMRGGRLWITGYPNYPVEQTQSRNWGAGALVGASTGALLGVAFGGWPGALLCGALGAILIASSGNSERR